MDENRTPVSEENEIITPAVTSACGMTASETPAESSATVAETPTSETAEQETPARPQPATKEEVISRLKEIVAEGCNVNRNEIDMLKQVY